MKIFLYSRYQNWFYAYYGTGPSEPICSFEVTNSHDDATN